MSARIVEARVEVGEVVCELAESPIWDDRSGALRWVDLDRGHVHGYSDERGQLPRLDLGQSVGFIVPCGADQLLAGLRDGFALVGMDGRVKIERELEAERPEMRMNDGRADAAGRLWAGTMRGSSPGPEGALYRLDGDWSVSTELSELTIPNGIGWSPDGATMYFTDSSWGRIDAFEYDLDSGRLGARRTFVEIPNEAGLPDGFTVDADGCVWVALWCGSAVHRYTPEGRLDTVVRLPALQTTSCVFGGADMRDLYITSARLDMTEAELADYPRSGRVFVCRPGAEGAPTRPFVVADPT